MPSDPMNYEALRTNAALEFFKEKGWSSISRDVHDWDAYNDILEELLGKDQGPRLLDVITKQDCLILTPKSSRAIESSLSGSTYGIAHFWQVGAGSAAIPADTIIFDGASGKADPGLFGSIFFAFSGPIPFEILDRQFPGLYRSAQWTHDSWQLTQMDPTNEEQVEEYGPQTRWIPADEDAQGFHRTADMGAIHGIMVSVVPSDWEKPLSFIMQNNSMVVHYVINRMKPGLGTNSFFEGMTTPEEAKEKVVKCKSNELFALLSHAKVPRATKFYSVYANLYPFTTNAICDIAEPIEFKTANALWTVAAPTTVKAREFQIAVATYLLGACYTIKGNIPRQVARRLNACRSGLGYDEVKEEEAAAFITNSNFVEGLPNSMAARIIGIAVAVVTTDKADPNTLKRKLLSVPEVGDAFNLDRFLVALYTQLRLVAENLQSSTIRFALAGLVSLKHLTHCTPDFIDREAEALRGLRSQLEDRPYTGCTDPIPANFTVASYPHLCYYGVEIYKASLSEKAQKEFENYKTQSIVEKMDTKNRRLVDGMIKQTPIEEDVITADFLALLTLEPAESSYEQLSDERKPKVRDILLMSHASSALGKYLKEQKEQDCLEKVNEVLLARITHDEAVTVKEISEKIEYANDIEEKNQLRAKRQAAQLRYSEIRKVCAASDESWETKISPEALAMWNDHYVKVTESLKEVALSAQRLDQLSGSP